MKSTPFDGGKTTQKERENQLKRVRRILRQELTPAQREVYTAHYLQGMSLPAIARMRGVNKTSVYRTFHRAEEKMRKFLLYQGGWSEE